MPVVTWSLTDITGARMDPKQVELVFELNAPNISTQFDGRVLPTEPVPVKPSPVDGTGQVTLIATAPFVDYGWYTVRIRWIGADAGAPLTDFPSWRFQVPEAGGDLGKLIADTPQGNGGSGSNPMLWWVGLTPPPSRARIWNYLDPDDPDRESGPIPGLTLGDIITKWW